MDNTSLYKRISIGIAAVNKALGSDKLEVVPIEVFPYVDGEIDYDEMEIINDGTDYRDIAYECSVISTFTMTCRWMKQGSNRSTPPDIRRGEKVEIRRYADTDEYYWIALGDDDNIRKLETVVHNYSGTTDEYDNVITEENSYQTEVSTHNKRLKITTSDHNGEVVKFDIEVNPGEGKYHFKDNLGNEFIVDSLEEYFKYTNVTGSEIEVIKEDINLTAVKSVNIKAGESINLEAPDITLKSTNFTNETTTMTNKSESYTNETTTATEKSSTYTNETDTMNIKASTYTNNSNTYTVKGSTLSITMSTGTMTGTYTMPGTLTVNTAHTTIITNNMVPIGALHTHTSSQPGSPTSPVIPG